MNNGKAGKSNVVKFMLLILVAIYALINFILFIVSCVAWSNGRTESQDDTCRIGDVTCGFTIWGLYPLIAAAAIICFVTAFVMTFNGFFRTRGSPFDPLFVFRGIFFTLLVLVPLLIVGWSRPLIIFFPPNLDDSNIDCDDCQSQDSSYILVAGMMSTGSEVIRAVYSGLSGAFVLQPKVEFRGSGITIVLAHLNTIFGALIAGLAAALAPPAVALVGTQGVGHSTA